MILLSWQDRDFRWSDVYVTEVIDACHFWAHVGGKVVIEKMEAINRELLSQVCFSYRHALLDQGTLFQVVH